MNLTKNPFSSIAIFIVIISSSTQRITINGNKIQKRKCSGLSVLTVIKIVQRPSSIVHRPTSIIHHPSSIVHRPGFSTCPVRQRDLLLRRDDITFRLHYRTFRQHVSTPLPSKPPSNRGKTSTELPDYHNAVKEPKITRLMFRRLAYPNLSSLFLLCHRRKTMKFDVY